MVQYLLGDPAQQKQVRLRLEPHNNGSGSVSVVASSADGAYEQRIVTFTAIGQVFRPGSVRTLLRSWAFRSTVRTESPSTQSTMG